MRKLFLWSSILALCCVVLLEWRLRTSAPLPGPPVAAQENALRILAVGDSITRGMDNERISYPRELERILARLPLKVPVQVWNEGISGAELLDVYRTIPALLSKYKPHVVLTMVGFREDSEVQTDWIRSLRVYRLFLRLRARYFPNETAALALKDEREFFDFVMRTGFDHPEYHRVFGARLRRANRHAEAIRYHEQVIEKYPWHEMAHVELGQIYAELDEFEMAERYFDAAIELAYPGGAWGGALKLLMYRKAKRFREAEQVGWELVRKHPHSFLFHEFLFDLYRDMGNRKAEEDVLNLALQNHGRVARLHTLFADHYHSVGNKDLERKHRTIAQELLQKETPNASAADLYRAVSEMVQERGVLHLVVQYPLQPLDPLKEWLGPESPFLRYVDNETNFRKALETGSYEDLFVDRFGGNFGHLTEKGNSIVAESVLSALNPWLKRQGFLP